MITMTPFNNIVINIIMLLLVSASQGEDVIESSQSSDVDIEISNLKMELEVEKKKVDKLTTDIEQLGGMVHELLKSVSKLTKEYVTQEDMDMIKKTLENNSGQIENMTSVMEMKGTDGDIEKKLKMLYETISDSRDSVEALVEETLEGLEMEIREMKDDLVRRLEKKEKRSNQDANTYVTREKLEVVVEEVEKLKNLPANLSLIVQETVGQISKDQGMSIDRDEFAVFQLSVARDTSRLRFNEGQWVTFQQRGQFGNQPEYFSRTLNEYTRGFGDPSREFWLGLDKLEMLTEKKDAELKVELETFEGQFVTATYSSFAIKGEDYKIFLSGYQGNAGDPLRIDNGMSFSTKDADKDHWSGSCSKTRGQGGWWFNGCGLANLNGQNLGPGKFSYHGILWYFYAKDNRSFKATRMMIRKK